MKGPKEIRRYIQRHRKTLKMQHWDDLTIAIKLYTCKNWFRRRKKPNRHELD